ncbi:MAG: hypothetical protein GX066_07760 [Clostridiaceae bacterium]|nr:hypothetical protein [Clostridiaceae bacterium]
MSEGFFGRLFGDDSEILFFIILFLLLFWGCRGCGPSYGGYGTNVSEA